jgi:catechol 2,3-dioxygenase-like lactoylglutathione lyase family enzyme
LPLGRFHEISLATTNIRASVEFYESLGFTQAPTTDAWPHPYGVLTDGRLFVGLHQRHAPSPALTFVVPNLAAHLPELGDLGIELSLCRTGEEVFNEIGFLDPDGHAVTGIEARTYSPVARNAAEVSLCGYFTEIGLPARDFEASRAFWEPLGFVAIEQTEDPFARLPLTSDHIDIAFHRPRTFDAPMLVFRDPDMRERIARLRDLGVAVSPELPRGLTPDGSALLESPEGMALLLMEGDA